MMPDRVSKDDTDGGYTFKGRLSSMESCGTTGPKRIYASLLPSLTKCPRSNKIPTLPTVAKGFVSQEQIGILHRRSIPQPVQKCRQLHCPTLEMASDVFVVSLVGVLDYDANDVRGHTSRAKDRPRILVVGQIGR